MKEFNPFLASGSKGELDGDASGHEDKYHRRRNVVYFAYVFTSTLVLIIYLSANAYARAHDPWLTPRFSNSMNVWRALGGLMLDCMQLLIFAGIPVLFFTYNLRQSLLVLFFVAVMIIVPFFVGRPF